MRIALLDYGAGNLHSLAKAVALTGAEVRCEPDPECCLDADLLVLPGVGSFPQAARRIAPARDVLRAAILSGFPVIGICLGMQLLMQGSEEGDGEGIGIVDGMVTRLNAPRVPQIGWNSLDDMSDLSLSRSGLRAAYYANGYACRPRDTDGVVAWSTHGDDRFPAMLRVHRAVGVQFHPEKSSTAGVRLLRILIEECAT
jgi:imidazole glycerol-phosphate synthase subunit HisH